MEESVNSHFYCSHILRKTRRKAAHVSISGSSTITTDVTISLVLNFNAMSLFSIHHCRPAHFRRIILKIRNHYYYGINISNMEESVNGQPRSYHGSGRPEF